MSQEQPQRSQQQQGNGQGYQGLEQLSVKYGDVFDVSGELASKPVAPRDAAMMQSAEHTVLGKTPAGGAASVMMSAASWNEKAGLVGHNTVTDVAATQGVTVTETEIPGGCIVTEKVGDQVVEQFVEARAAAAGQQVAITIGEALEAAAQTCGDKAVDRSDAAAIQAAEQIATGNPIVIPGGLAAAAQSAAVFNESTLRNEDKIKLSQVLAGATARMPADKVASRQDAEGVGNAERWNNPKMETQTGGVSASLAAAARINESINP